MPKQSEQTASDQTESDQAALPPISSRYTGKVVAITGAASGIGRCIALRLAAEGATVFGIDINAEGLAAVAEEVAEADNKTATNETDANQTAANNKMSWRVTDIADPAECRAAIAQCVDQHQRLDVLGNVAGICWLKPVADVSAEDWRKLFAINVDGSFFMCQAALPHIIASEGSIINIASNSAFMGAAYLVPYCAAKGAVVQMTRALATEFVKEPIRINAIAPGGTDTPLHHNIEMADGIDFKLVKRSMGFRPLDAPEQIAALFAFLASSEAANIHGAIINADSGMTAT